MKIKNTTILSGLALCSMAITACFGAEPERKFEIPENYEFSYNIGSDGELKNVLESTGLFKSKESLCDSIGKHYTHNSYGDFGFMYLTNIDTAIGKLDGKEIKTKYVNYSKQSYFEKVEEGMADPAAYLCWYNLDSNGYLRFFNMEINPGDLSISLIPYSWDGFIFSLTTSSQYTITEKEMKIEKDVLNATFNAVITVDKNVVIDVDISTNWKIKAN